MDVRSVPLGDVTEADESAWRALAARALEPNPALEPEALRAAAACLPSWRELPLLVVTDGEDMVLCALARPTRRWHRLPVPALTSHPEDGAVPIFVVLGAPLVDPVRAEPAIAALLSALKTGEVRPHGGRRAALITLERWRADGALAAAWARTCEHLSLPVAVFDRWERPVLLREGALAEGWPAPLGERRIAELERRRRRLARAVGGPVEWRDRSGEKAAVDDFVRLEAGGWKGAAGTALAADARRTGAFTEACGRWAADGRLVMLGLEAAGTVLAVRCAVRSGRGYFLVKSTYDQRYARFAPGLLLQLATAEHFLSATDASWMDPCCAPSNTFFPAFLPHRLAVASATTALAPAGVAAMRAAPVLERAGTWLRPNLARLTAGSSARLTAGSSARLTAGSSARLTAGSSPRVTARSSARVTARSSPRVTARSTRAL
jgi:hypothetical protein